MQKTANYGLNKPEIGEFYNVEEFNENADLIDTKLKEFEDGTTTVGNADTLDGFHADNFVKQAEKLSTDILDLALTLENGVHEFVLNGSSYPEGVLPLNAYRYGNATVYKRGDTSIAVAVWGTTDSSSKPILPIFNYYNANGWTGWKTMDTAENRPNGSYTGNGDATTRTVDTGGTGNVCLIYSGSGNMLVSYHGAYFNETWKSTINFRGGVLTIVSNDTLVNANGTTYYYQVL